ncbi:MAG: hypothetical protein OEM02_15635, partial [Desulfobulbaceae bacterium]|nr:hypothetical protein [Desulfobulbaceae bacterium]
WGWFHGTLLIIEHFIRDYRIRLPFMQYIHPTIRWMMQISGMYLLTLFGWLLFRLTDISVLPIFVKNVLTNFYYSDKCSFVAVPVGVTFFGLILLHIIQELKNDEMIVLNQSREVVYGIYTILIFMIISVGGKTVPFIYFQF